MTDEGKAEISPEEAAREDIRARRQRRREEREQQQHQPAGVDTSSQTAEPPAPELEPSAEPALSPRLRRRRRRGRIACLLGMLLGFAGLIAGRLGVLWIHFDVFSQFTLHFAAMVVAFLIGYLMPRGRVLAAIVVVGLAMTAIGLWPHAASRSVGVTGSLNAGERVVRIMSFNTKLSSHNTDAVADEVLRNDPDIAILIEFSEEKRAALDKLRARYPYQTDCFGIPDCYLALVAKHPFANVEPRGVWTGPPLIKATFGPELGGLTVIGIHTIRFPHQRAHLRQIEELTRFLDGLEGPRVVAGDFNATPFSRILSTFAERSRMNRLTMLPTWSARFLQLPQLAIDHVFAGRGVREIEAERIGRNAGSDHYPVVVGLAVSPP